MYKSILPKYYFVTSGKGLSKISQLNAFDRALQNAGISQYNLVPVSSIIPPNAKEIKPVTIEPGSVVFTVMAKEIGKSKEKISAGLAWFKDNSNKRYGYVIEGHAKNRDNLGLELKKMIEEMGKDRGQEIPFIKMRVETLEIPEGYYGSVLVALIFLL